MITSNFYQCVKVNYAYPRFTIILPNGKRHDIPRDMKYDFVEQAEISIKYRGYEIIGYSILKDDHYIFLVRKEY